MIHFDERWHGAHGIGRFSMELAKRIPHATLAVDGRPMSAFDAVRMSLVVRSLPRGSLVFSPGYNAPLWSAAPFVFTVHDLNHIDRPENSSVAKRLFYATVLKRACRDAAAVLTVSEYSRRRIAAWSGVPPGRVVNVGNGVGANFHPGVEPHLPGYPYVLCVSNRRLHKNELRVVQAFGRAGLDVQMRLLFTGQPTPALSACITRAGLDGRVLFCGPVDEATLPSIYRGASLLAFPSLYEGFGLPVVEAFACGTPVVTSNTTSLPEVAGGAALLVDPLSVDEIAAAFHRAATDADLRRSLTERGLRRAAAYSWSDVANRVTATLTVASQRR